MKLKMALAWALIVFWIDAADCILERQSILCSETLTFGSVNVCERFDRIGIEVGCIHFGKGKTGWNKQTCQKENYCDCEDTRSTSLVRENHKLEREREREKERARVRRKTIYC